MRGRFLPRAPKSEKLWHFHPPKTKSPSQYRQTAPIPTTIPISGGRNRTGRVKTSPKRARTVKDVGVTPGTTGQSFIRLGAVGIRIRKTPPRFSNFLGRRTNFPPHRGATGSNQRQGRGRFVSRAPKSEKLWHFHPPKTKSPSQYRQTAPIPTTIPISGGRNRTGRAKMSRALGGADF